MLRTTVVVALCLPTFACKTKIKRYPAPPGVRLVVVERRVAGALAAPDDAKVYLVSSADALLTDATMIFEGQDMGAICYRWASPTELHISVSAGYPDQVFSRWTGRDGRSVKLIYEGARNCAWSPQTDFWDVPPR
jgi:hypothetical protein